MTKGYSYERTPEGVFVKLDGKTIAFIGSGRKEKLK